MIFVNPQWVSSFFLNFTKFHWVFNGFLRILLILSYFPMMAVYIYIYTLRGISDFWTPGHGFSRILVHFSSFSHMSTNFPANQTYLMRMCSECKHYKGYFRYMFIWFHKFPVSFHIFQISQNSTLDENVPRMQAL